MRILRNDGISVVALVIVLLLLSTLGTVLVSLIITKQKSALLPLKSAQAFYAAQAGIEYAIRYTCDHQWFETGVKSDFWTNRYNVFPMTKNLGAGSFAVTCDAVGRTITSTGTVSSGERQIQLSRFPEYVVGGDVVPIPGNPPVNPGPGSDKIAIPISNYTGSTLYIFQIDMAKDLGGTVNEVTLDVKPVFEKSIVISSNHGIPTQIDFMAERPRYALQPGTIINNKFTFTQEVVVDDYTVIYHYYFEGGSETDNYTSKVRFTIP